MTGSALYLLILLPLAVAFYWLIPNQRARRIFLASVSAFILLQYAGLYALPTLGCVVWVYLFAEWAAGANRRLRTFLAAIAVAAPLGWMIAVKWPEGIGASPPSRAWITPLAVSYLSFQLIHFAVERARGNIAAPVSRATFASYALMFPTLPAGPIKRYENFRAQAESAQIFRSDEFSAGLFRVALGFLKKGLVAQAGLVWLDGWKGATETTLVAWCCAWFYFLYIYADFSGYSDIAIGTARMLGYRIEENFRWPILSANPSEYWKRWHMSLTGFVRDYVFIPLGGSRAGAVRTALCTVVAMSVVGVWHGFTANFLAWGLYHAFLLLAWRVVKRLASWRVETIAARRIGAFVTFNLVAAGWVLFDRPLAEALAIWRSMLLGG